MSESKRSFWAGAPGLVTGIAGLLTGVVGLVTVLTQLDMIGGEDAGPAATTTIVGQAPGVGSAGVTTTISGRLTAEPSILRLQPTERAKDVVVRNASSATLTVVKPVYTGADGTSFSTDSGCTDIALRPGGSCTVKVQLAATGALRTYQANLVLEAKEIPQVTEVRIEAITIL